jgi:hypothetical protein
MDAMAETTCDQVASAAVLRKHSSPWTTRENQLLCQSMTAKFKHETRHQSHVNERAGKVPTSVESCKYP